MSKIIVAGSINMDIVAEVKSQPRPGETIFGHDLHYIPGGKGSNQAVAASRLGENVYLVGKLGRDAFGNSLTDFLKNESLNLDYLFYSEDHPTGIALITVDENSENSIIVISGSNFQLSTEDIEEIALNEDDVVVSVFEIPQTTIKYLFERARQSGAKTVLNPAPATAFIDGLLETVDYLIVNETELAFFSGHDETGEDINMIVQQAQQLRKFDGQTIIVTLGSKGVVCVNAEDSLRIEGISVKAIDTTGAGDCFTGAFAVAIAEQMPIDKALQFANRAASISVQRLGASTSMPTRSEVT